MKNVFDRVVDSALAWNRDQALRVSSPGQVAYEEDVRRYPWGPSGEERLSWGDLPDIARESWENKPVPRPRRRELPRSVTVSPNNE